MSVTIDHKICFKIIILDIFSETILCSRQSALLLRYSSANCDAYLDDILKLIFKINQNDYIYLKQKATVHN